MRALALAALLAAAGCGSSSSASNFAGNFTVAITNGANGCNFPNWTQGQMSSNIGVTITQNGTAANATVGGIAGAYMSTVLGSNVFAGTVQGSAATLTLHGTRQYTQGNCAYTITATMNGGLMGDFITGTIDYTTATNGSPDCGAITNCQSVQDFNGTRPPSP